MVSSGPSTGEEYLKGEVYEYNWDCLPCGDYEFTIKDTFGDGMCYGEVCGSYKLVVNGSIVAEGNENKMFQFSESSMISCNIFE